MTIRVPYVNTVDNLADFFTKPLTSKTFFRLRDRIMNVDPEVAGDSYGGVLNDAASDARSSDSSDPTRPVNVPSTAPEAPASETV